MTGDEIVAAATLIVAALTLTVALGLPFVLRHRDRVDLHIERIAHEGDRIVVHARNRGGSPARQVGIMSGKGHRFDYVGVAVLAGRSSDELVIPTALLARDPWRVCPPIRLVDESGHKSALKPFPPSVKPHLEELIRVSPQITQ
jgi:hypothetical protein